MARSDRLFRLIDALRRLPAPVTSARLAADLGVSLRTIYRDIDTLRAAGTLIDGAPGYGYSLTEDPAMPPQMLTRLEIEAVTMGLQEMQQSGDAGLAAAAETALTKIIASLPERKQREAMHAVQHLWRGRRRDIPAGLAGLLRGACWEEREVRIRYADAEGATSERTVRPLVLTYLDRVLILVAWCCLREDFRQFRIDRIAAAEMTGTSFRPRRVGLLRDFVRSMESARESG